VHGAYMHKLKCHRVQPMERVNGLMRELGLSPSTAPPDLPRATPEAGSGSSGVPVS